VNTYIKSVVIILCLTLITSVQLFGQEWSAQQKEVWKNVQAYSDLATKRDVEGFLNYFHSDYSGWSNRSALPSTKEQVRKWIAHDFATTKILVSEIKPVAIKIHGNIAIVHYYWSQIEKNQEGKETNTSGRWTDILMKQADKWVLIGDQGGRTSSN
jgi:ketosteroid isomerase-like protein